jgi:hypothetical protein
MSLCKSCGQRIPGQMYQPIEGTCFDVAEKQKAEWILQGAMGTGGMDSDTVRFVPFIGDGSCQGLEGQLWTLNLPRVLFSESARIAFDRRERVNVTITLCEELQPKLMNAEEIAERLISCGAVRGFESFAQFKAVVVNLIKPFEDRIKELEQS